MSFEMTLHFHRLSDPFYIFNDNITKKQQTNKRSRDDKINFMSAYEKF